MTADHLTSLPHKTKQQMDGTAVMVEPLMETARRLAEALDQSAEADGIGAEQAANTREVAKFIRQFAAHHAAAVQAERASLAAERDAAVAARDAMRECVRRIGVTAEVAWSEDDIYTTPKQSRDALCAAIKSEIAALAQGGDGRG